jgi:drug/metabolite transporter (DMT)-like permease
VSIKTYGYAFALLSATCFGTLAVSGKFAYQDGIEVGSLMAWRFGVAALGFWLIIFLKRSTFIFPRAIDAFKLFSLGAIILALEVTLFFMGLAAPGMSAGLAETIFFVYPTWVVLIAAAFLSHRISVAMAGCVGLAITGVALTAGSLKTESISGVVYLLMASILYAIYVALSGQWMKGVSPFVATTWMITGAGFSLIVYALATNPQGPSSINGWLSVGSAIALGTFGAYALLYAALHRIPSPVAAVLTTAEPVVAVFLGVILLSETMTALQILGSVLILGAVILLLWWDSKGVSTVEPAALTA